MTWGLWGITAVRTAMPAHYHEEGDDGHGHLDGKWQPGDTAHFEYHCWQAPASNDYDLWQRTQQPVTVLMSQTDGDDVSDEAPTFMERVSEWGMPLTYHVRFGDGHEGVVTEDELHTHPKHFHPSYEFHPRNRQDGLSTPLPGYDKTGDGWAEYEQSRNRKARTMTAAVTVYTRPNCPQCDATKRQLERLGVEHAVVDVTADPEAHSFVTGLGYQAAPVVVVDGGDHWSGFRPDRLRGLVGGE